MYLLENPIIPGHFNYPPTLLYAGKYPLKSPTGSVYLLGCPPFLLGMLCVLTEFPTDSVYLLGTLILISHRLLEFLIDCLFAGNIPDSPPPPPPNYPLALCICWELIFVLHYTLSGPYAWLCILHGNPPSSGSVYFLRMYHSPMTPLNYSLTLHNPRSPGLPTGLIYLLEMGTLPGTPVFRHVFYRKHLPCEAATCWQLFILAGPPELPTGSVYLVVHRCRCLQVS